MLKMEKIAHRKIYWIRKSRYGKKESSIYWRIRERILEEQVVIL
jgi:hypothetical protein